MAELNGRRPYRVVFAPAGHTGLARRGIIVTRDEATAHQEARRVAAAGGWAQVHHIDDHGERHVLADYPGQASSPHRAPSP